MGFLNGIGAEINFIKNAKSQFLLFKKLKNNESAQLWA